MRNQTGSFPAIVEQLSIAWNEPVWLRQVRMQAASIAEDALISETSPESLILQRLLGDPDAVQRYITRRTYRPAPREAWKLPAITPSGRPCRGLLVQQDGQRILSSIDDALVKYGVIMTGLDSAVERYPELVQPYLQRLPGSPALALRLALWNSGIFIYLPKYVKVNALMRNFHWASALSVRYSLIVLEEDTRLFYFDEYAGAENATNSVATLELYAGANARPHIMGLRSDAAGTRNSDYTIAHLQEDARFRNTLAWSGSGAYNELAIESDLQGAGSGATVSTLIAARAAQNYVCSLRARHAGVASSSEGHVYAFLKDQAVFEGAGSLEFLPAAAQANAFSYCHALQTGDAQASWRPNVSGSAANVHYQHADDIRKLQAKQAPPVQTRHDGENDQAKESKRREAAAGSGGLDPDIAAADQFFAYATRNLGEPEVRSKMLSKLVQHVTVNGRAESGGVAEA